MRTRIITLLASAALLAAGCGGKQAAQQPAHPGPITAGVEEARILLLRAAELNEPNAKQLIHCLQSEGCWGHNSTETK